MPTPKAYAAVDLGASSGRVMLGVIDAGVWRFDEIHRFANAILPTDAGDAWDLALLFDETLEGLRLAVERCERSSHRLSGVGVDSWGVDWSLIGADGEAELPGLSYRGAADPAGAIAARGLTAHEVYGITGIPDHAINTALRLARDARSRDFAGETLLFVPDLWVYWLSGEIGTDPTIASTSQLLDARTGEFSRPVLAALGLDGLTMPRVAPVGSVAGLVRAELRERIGAAYDIPVFRVAGHDTAAAFSFADPRRDGSVGGAGSGGSEGSGGGAGDGSRDGLISSGTWSIVAAACAEPVTSARAEQLEFANERGAAGVLLLRNLTGLWMLQECLREWGENGEPAELLPLLELVRDRGFDARTFEASDPALFGAGGMEQRLREVCARIGRPVGPGREDVVQAIIDSLAATYAGGVTAVEEVVERRFDRIRIVGGGSRNARLCQLTADLSGRPVLAGPTEASAIGNIAIQAAADGCVGHPAEVFGALAPGETRLYTPHANPSAPTAEDHDA